MVDPNRELFESVVRLLRPVLDELVFVGGCTTGLLITDPAASAIRPTKDVDVIVDVTSYAKYAAPSERLVALGLNADTTEGAPLCRWRHDDLIVDVMPIDEDVLGFSNRWYPSAIKTAQIVSIAGQDIRDEIGAAEAEVRKYITSEIEALLSNDDFLDTLAGFLLPDPASQARRPLLERRLRAIAGVA